MSKAFITILGLIPEKKDRAKYTLSEELKKSISIKDKNYTNMFPLIIDNFSSEYDIYPIFTEKALNIQNTVLKSEELTFKDFKQDFKIKNENDFNEIFHIINDALSSDYNELIIDLSHGFRHLPILAIINLIMLDIKDSDKIKHILFAKEIISFKEYEIIDLKEYLDIAKLLFTLTAFNSNYTVGNKLTFLNKNYQDLVDNLRIISTHILANSLQQLIGSDSLIHKTVESLKQLLLDDKLRQFTNEINNIIEHMNRIKNLDKEKEYIQFFQLAKMMDKRGYLLNSITLLNESMGFYCAEKLQNMDEDIYNYIEDFKSIENYIYPLTHQSKNIIKLKKEFDGLYLSKHPERSKKITESIKNNLIKEDNEELISLIKDIENLRNNLAHGNSSEKIDNIKKTLYKLFKKFEKIAKITKKEIDTVSPQKKDNQRKNIKMKEEIKGINVPMEKIDELSNFFK